MPKNPRCFMPACGVDGRLCPDCAGYFPPRRPPFGKAEGATQGTTYDVVIRIMEGARCVREEVQQITVQTPNIDDFIRNVFNHAPTITSAPPPDGAERVWGFPVVENPAIPPGMALVGTPCGCHWTKAVEDGGTLLHMAKRHCVVIKFSDDAQTNPPEETPGDAPGNIGGGNCGG